MKLRDRDGTEKEDTSINKIRKGGRSRNGGKMKEVYRSFEGMLGVDNREGHIIYELEKFYEIHILNVYSDGKDDRVRINKDLLSEADFGDIGKIGHIQLDIENGCGDYGQCWFNGKWYGCKTIRKIQDSNNDMNWKKHV